MIPPHDINIQIARIHGTLEILITKNSICLNLSSSQSLSAWILIIETRFEREITEPISRTLKKIYVTLKAQCQM